MRHRTARLAALVAFAALAVAWALAGASEYDKLPDLIQQGRRLYYDDKLQDAFAKFSEAARLEPDLGTIHLYLARIHARLGRFADATQELKRFQYCVTTPTGGEAKRALDTVLSAILAQADLGKRAEALAYMTETLRGLPRGLERRIDAHLMAIYAKTGRSDLEAAVTKRYFANRPIPWETYFDAGRTYLDYGVRLPLAASYLEQAIDALRQPPPPTGDPAKDELERRRRAAEVTMVEDCLACALHAAGTTDPKANRLNAIEPEPKATFLDVTKAAGLDGVPALRVAVGDYDGDGYEDLCVCGRIFRNNLGAGFTETTRQGKVDPRGVVAALWLDYDNDGHLDLLCASEHTLRLWRNRADGTFDDASAKAGLDPQFPGTPEVMAAIDYDADGHLDLFVGCIEGLGEKARCLRDFVLHGDGKGGFEDQSERSGIASASPHFTRGCAWGDFNDDGRSDLYVANDRYCGNQLWANQGDGRFVDEAQRLGAQGVPGAGRLAQAFGNGISCAWGDIDNDGDLDLVVANRAEARYLEIADPTALYVNSGREGGYRFHDAAAESGIRFEETPGGTSLADFDNDGDLDLFLGAIGKHRPTALYQNDGGGRFRPVTWRAGVVVFDNWGQAWFDKDNDGDLDLVLAGPDGIHLFENRSRDTSWMRVQLVGARSNRQGIGSRVTLEAGPLRLTREVTAASGSTLQSSPIAHFGLGSYKGTVDITIRWPSGAEQQVTRVESSRVIRVAE